MGQQKHTKHTKHVAAKDDDIPESAADTPETIVQKPHWRRTFFEISLALVIVAMVWTTCNLFLSRTALGNATIPTRSTQASIEKALQTLTTNYQLSFLYPNGKKASFSLAQMGMSVDMKQTSATIRDQKYKPGHFLTWWQVTPLELKIKVHDSQLTAFVANNIRIAEQPAHNAELHINDGKILLTPEMNGVVYSLENAAQTIRVAASTLQKTPLALVKMPLSPQTTSASVNSTKTRLQSILDQHITIHVGNQTITPSATDIGNWITLTPQETTYKIEVNTDAVTQFVANAAKNSSQPARSQVSLDSTGQILQAGAQGVVAGDSGDAAQTVSNTLLQAQGSTVTVPVRYTAFSTVEAPTLGKWIEVNVATKRMYAYSDGQLARTFLVSAGAAATPTVTGHFAIYAKYRSQNMFGENADGSGYNQPNVPYINYFYRDYAIHGNYWRPTSYFGAINSSHGCVGLPVSDSAWIYNWAPIGTPVIVHT